jgi:uncharacterized protein YukE
LEGWAFRDPRKGDYRLVNLTETALQGIAKDIQQVTQGFAGLLPRLAQDVPHLKDRWGGPGTPAHCGLSPQIEPFLTDL